MSGYAASARLRGGSTRFLAVAPDRPVRDRAAHGTPPAWLDREQVEGRGRALGERLSTALAELRETWSQTTFYLFDPDSWR